MNLMISSNPSSTRNLAMSAQERGDRNGHRNAGDRLCVSQHLRRIHNLSPGFQKTLRLYTRWVINASPWMIRLW